jgi:hypothetical protein
MPRPDQRRLPLLVVVVAVLALLGAVVLDGPLSRVAPAASAGAVEGVAAPANGSADTAGAVKAAEAADAAADVRGVGARPGERSLFVQWNAEHRRPPVPTAPALMVLAAALLAMAGAGSYVAPAVRHVVCRVAHAHVRRRGPPALAVI